SFAEPLTWALQHHLGHKNIMRTVRYTKLSPDWFRGFGRVDREGNAEMRPRSGLAPACLTSGKLNVCWHASYSAARITIRMFPEVKPERGVRDEKRAMRDAKKPRFCTVVDVHPSASGGITCTSRRA